MKIEVKKHKGKWLVNGDNPNNLSPSESKSLDALIIVARLQSLGIKECKEMRSLPDWESLLKSE